MSTLVKNKKGHRESPSCVCDTFLCHWENYAHKKATICSRSGCTEKNDLVGAHIIKCHGNAKKTQYIVPLCKKCNNSVNTECFPINKNVVLAPVSDNTYCKPCN